MQLGYSAPFLFNEYSIVLQDKVVEAAEAAGFEMLAPTNADSDSAQQNTDIRNLISAGADALIVFANDSNAIVPSLDYAAEQGVPVVAIDVAPDGGEVEMIVRVDNIGMGTAACELMAETIGFEGKVLSLQGAATSINGRERTQGFAECMAQYPDIELIERPTDWDPEKQVAALQTVLTANPDLKGVFQQAEYALEATNAVLDQAGFTAKVGEDGHIVNVSIDATPAALDLVREGVMDAADLPADRPLRLAGRAVLGGRDGRRGVRDGSDRSRQRDRRVQRQPHGLGAVGRRHGRERRQPRPLGEPGPRRVVTRSLTERDESFALIAWAGSRGPRNGRLIGGRDGPVAEVSTTDIVPTTRASPTYSTSCHV